MKPAWGWVLAVLVACGGRASRSEQTEPSPGGSAGATSSGGSSIGGGATSSLRGCPDPGDASCSSRFLLDLHFDGTSTMTADGAVWAEPLQLPEFPPTTGQPPPAPVEPADWDRSRLPAGACVFKLHGARASCITGKSGRVSAGPCDQEPPLVVPLGYYELNRCADGVAPGCSGDYPWLADNSFWYAAPEPGGRDETLLVLCAGICQPFTSTEGAKMCVLGGPAQ